MSTPVMDVPAIIEMDSIQAASWPPQWASHMHGFENASRAEGAFGQSKDK